MRPGIGSKDERSTTNRPNIEPRRGVVEHRIMMSLALYNLISFFSDSRCQILNDVIFSHSTFDVERSMFDLPAVP